VDLVEKTLVVPNPALMKFARFDSRPLQQRFPRRRHLLSMDPVLRMERASAMFFARLSVDSDQIRSQVLDKPGFTLVEQSQPPLV
jgi:hypothetical protein